MKGRLTLFLILGGLGLFLTWQSAFTVTEFQQVVITQFGKPVGEAKVEPGFYFKLPFVQQTNVFEKRYMAWDGDPNQIPTKDKKFIFVDTYARWQITDPLQFFKRLNSEINAQSRIDDILDGATRNFIANHNLEEAVRSTNRTDVPMDTVNGVSSDTLPQIMVGREKIQQMILKSANSQASDLGIEVLDFRFKRINYVQEVQAQVYERMKSERFRIADKFRSEGQGEASRINGEKERDLKSIQSEAFKTAEEVRGKADAEAASIYAQSYDQSNQARQFYQFLKSMETLEKTASEEKSLILSTDSELFRFLKEME